MMTRRATWPGARLSILSALALLVLLSATLATPRRAEAAPAQRRLPVILVHGITNEEKMWREDQESPAWVNAVEMVDEKGKALDDSPMYNLYRVTRSDLFDKDGSVPVYVFEYHPYEGATGDILTNGASLAEAIDIVKDRSGEKQVFLAAYSMGGLVSRAYMQGVARGTGYRDDVAGLCTIDTPHRGCSAAERVGAILTMPTGNPSLGVALGRAIVTFARGTAGRQMTNERAVPGTPLPRMNYQAGPIPGGPQTIIVGNYFFLVGDVLLTQREQRPPGRVLGPGSEIVVEKGLVHNDGLNQWVLGGSTAYDDPEVKKVVRGAYLVADAKYQAANPAPDPADPAPSSGVGATSIVLDVSDSMTEEFQAGTKIDQARERAQDVVDIIEGISAGRGETVEVGVAKFSDEADEVLPVTADYDEVKRAIAGLDTMSMTNLRAAILEGTAQLEAVKGPKAMILLSDGMDTMGNTHDDIMDAAKAAKDADITIFTIGFGEQGSLDWDILEEIADVTGGTASLADPTDKVALGKVFIKATIQTTDEILGEFEGTVAQGKTVEAGEIKVADQATDMQGILYWPGSVLEMKLTDPSGSVVASGYPGYTVVRDTAPAQVFVKNPKIGTWKVSVFGKETSMDQEPYYALLSSRESSAPPLSGGGGVPTSDGSMLLLVVLGIVGAGGIAALVLRQSGGRSSAEMLLQPERSVPVAHLKGESGTMHGLKIGENPVGRSSANTIILAEPSVSREHAIVLVSGSGMSVTDLQSTYGTRVNGRKVSESVLVNGDTVEFGKSRFTVVNPPAKIIN